MRRHKIFWIWILAAMAMVSCSTSDDTLGSDTPEEGEYSDTEWTCSCPVDSLVHHDAVEATELEFGNIEYWECPSCGKTYTDASKTNVPEDGVCILPKSIILGDSLLPDNDWVLNFDELNDGEEGLFKKISSKFPVVGLVVGCIGLANNIIGRTTDIDAQNWNLAFKSLQNIKNKLEVVDKKLSDISRQITAIPYRMNISDRNTYINAIKFKTYECFSLINDYLNDKNLSKDQKTEKVKQTLKFYCESTYAGVTFDDIIKKLMHEYYTGTIGEAGVLDYPLMWENYINGLTRWEHEGYKTRCEIMLNDIVYLYFGWCMTYIYYSDVKGGSEASKAIALDELKNLRDEYNKACIAGIKRMKDRSLTLRRFNPLHKSYNKWVYDVSSDDYITYFKNNKSTFIIPGNEWNLNRAVKSWNVLYYDLKYSQHMFMSPEQAREIYDVCNKGKKKKESLYYLLSDSTGVGLTGGLLNYRSQKGGYKYVLCCPFKGSPSKKRGLSYFKSKYLMFFWDICWEFHDNNDQIGIQSIKDDGTLGKDLIIKKCQIACGGENSGLIESYGTNNKCVFRSIHIVEDK